MRKLLLRPLSELLWRLEKRRWHAQFCRAQARAASGAELRWYASGHGLLCPVGRAAFRREAKRRLSFTA